MKVKKYFKRSWSYLAGAVLISVLQGVTIIVTGNPLGITSAYSFWANQFAAITGIQTSAQSEVMSLFVKLGQTNWKLVESITLRNMGIILGALLSVLLAAQFRLKKIKSGKQVVAAAAGGLLMGYGSSIASGCNIGAFFSGIASMSLSGWVFGIFLFIGAVIGGKLMLRYLV